MATNRARGDSLRWYLRYSLSFRDVEEMLNERGLEATTRQSGAGFSATALNWRSGYAVISSQPISPGVWDETYVRVKGRWCYLYRPSIPPERPIDFVLSGLRDARYG